MEFEAFAAALATFRQAYRQPVESDDWERTTRLYWAKLRSYGQRVLMLAFDDAFRAHPRFFPSLGELDAICLARVRRVRMEQPALFSAQPSETKRARIAHMMQHTNRALRTNDTTMPRGRAPLSVDGCDDWLAWYAEQCRREDAGEIVFAPEDKEPLVSPVGPE